MVDGQAWRSDFHLKNHSFFVNKKDFIDKKNLRAETHKFIIFVIINFS